MNCYRETYIKTAVLASLHIYHTYEATEVSDVPPPFWRQETDPLDTDRYRYRYRFIRAESNTADGLTSGRAVLEL